jgi:hypothetical protein
MFNVDDDALREFIITVYVFMTSIENNIMSELILIWLRTSVNCTEFY